MREQAIEAAIAASASKATYAGAAATGLGWLLSSEAAVLFGIVGVVAGLIVNWYYQAKRDRREEREHLARMSELK